MAKTALRLSNTSNERLGLSLEDRLVNTNWIDSSIVSEALSSASDSYVTPARVYVLCVLDAAMRQVAGKWSQQPMASHAVASMQSRLREMPDFEAFANEFAPDAWEVVFRQLIVSNVGAKDMHLLVATDLEMEARFEAVSKELRGGTPVKGKSIVEALWEPIRRFSTLDEQVRFVLEEWSEFLDTDLRQLLLRSTDYLKESWTYVAPGPPGRTLPTHSLGSKYAHQERFSEDREWMPSVVLIAKNIYVWLHQLSATYGKDIQRLDQIPDQELQLLRSRGITGLWMIGLWERSDASRRIKELCGSPMSVASAYSIYDYKISYALGGDDAWANLSERAWRFGIRLAADMVPNHMGIVSEWTKNSPDLFLNVSHPPYPNYRFHGEDLSDDPNLSIHLEDQYYDRTDASVVFRHIDHRTGQTRYIYHGNDGTSMPWNDTAQIDFLNPAAREAVIQAILDVAKKFSIIRFDAAMTLVRKHVQRLWYPQPGHGGAIPSRSRYGISQEEFDQRMPREFWQEVVDRVQAEAPDTLLLAEAFWMLEGYFVRSLGMHRVYNSAFMNMLRDEDNAGYRKLMKDTLAFDPQVLKRYVNFMNNPDEDTAVDQFGKGDKYFGVAILMVTMPGLPMLGHGQIEGFAEKYGMDFRRPLLHESPDAGLVAEHERVLFPLIHQRRLFAEVDEFALYDFLNTNGIVNENVFAYSNRAVDSRALVIYHNRYETCSGWVRSSVGEVGGDLGGHLDLPLGAVARFRDAVSNKWYLRRTDALKAEGLYIELQAYGSHVFSEWSFEYDASWFELCDHLNGRPVYNFKVEWVEMRYGTIRSEIHAFLALEVIEPSVVKDLVESLSKEFNLRPLVDDDELLSLEWPDASPARLVALLHGLDEDNPLFLFEQMGLEDVVEFPRVVGAALAVLPESRAKDWLKSEHVQQALGVHVFDGTRYYNEEMAAEFVGRFPSLLSVRCAEVTERRAQILKDIKDFKEALALSGYDFDRVDLNNV